MPPSQHVDVPKQQFLPAKWLELKKEYDVRTGCGLQVDWDTICRETQASAACYGYLAGQLTNNIQATAQDKAAQLRQAVRDGWKQYRAKGKGEAAVSDPNSAASQQDRQHYGQLKTKDRWRWTCPKAGCARKVKGYGESANQDQERVTCQACGSYFRTGGRPKSQSSVQVHLYSCPACGAEVESEIANGTVHVLHKTAAGKKCKHQFRVKDGIPNTFHD